MLRSLLGSFRVLGALMFGTRVVLCLVVLAMASGLRHANAMPLDDAAERYRPYMIEGIGSALAGAPDLRGGIAAKGLAGGEKGRLSGPRRRGGVGGITPRLRPG